MTWVEPTAYELREARAMALAVNGGDWEADYTEAQRRGWILKVRWALDRYVIPRLLKPTERRAKIKTE